MKEHVEVVVVGGGVTGCSITYYLAKEGVRVSLIERGELSSGCSGACFGGIMALSSKPPMLDWIVRSIKLYDSLEEELEFDVGFERGGSYALLNNESLWAETHDKAVELRDRGIDARIIDGNELREMEPALGESVIGAITCPTDGWVVPMKTCYGFAKAAKRLGAEINTFTELRDIEVRSGKVKSVSTDKGRIEADFVVNAAGAWAPSLGEMVGLRIPIYPLRGQVVVTERMPLLHLRYLVEVELMTKELLRVDARNKKSEGLGFAFLQYEEGNCMIGSNAEFADYDRKTTFDIIERILKRAVTFVPKLKNVSFIRTYAGLRPHSEDGLPIWGRVDTINGYILATGQGGRGNCLAPLTGKLIAELITKGKPSINIDEFGLSRFEKEGYCTFPSSTD